MSIAFRILGGNVVPEIGDIGVKYRQRIKFIWHACLDCGKERWVQLIRGEAGSPRCSRCANRRKHGRGAQNPNWKGGRLKDKMGYIQIRLWSDDFFYPMVKSNGYVFEHRLVVARALGRCLHRWEIVHHKRGYAKDDNRYPETLQLVTDDRHNQITILERRIAYLEDEIAKQGKLIRLLQWQTKEASKISQGRKIWE